MPEKEIVYLLGAGFNQCVKDWDGLKPPLATNFFQTIQKSKKYNNEHYYNKVKPVYDYIERYWKKNMKNLLNEPFDLEECFTFLELQLHDVLNSGNQDEIAKLENIVLKLQTMYAEILSEFDNFSHMSDTLRSFSKKIYNEKPTIITFNNDCILETAIESTSGVRKEIPESFFKIPKPKSFNGNSKFNQDVPYEELPYSHYNWNRPLGYGIKFDRIRLQRAGISRYVEGSEFYNHPDNNVYDWKILKLHGSLNWFKFLPIKKYNLYNDKEKSLSLEKQKNVILADGNWWFNELPQLDGWIIHPLIITPILYKQKYYHLKIFMDLWAQAKMQLKKCKRLIIIGYSFPPTDFAIKKLLLESFEKNKLNELIVVNPDNSVIKIIQDLVHFTKPVTMCNNLKEFIKINFNLNC